MNISLHTFLVVCPLVFSRRDSLPASGGGGGLIFTSSFFNCRAIRPHAAIATNRISAAIRNQHLRILPFMREAKLINF